jgi:glycosyltransferase involved in cell wall biosynthesis
MKVLVDHQIFLNQSAGGVSRYHATINDYINGFNQGIQSRIIALGHRNIYLPEQGKSLSLLNRRGLLRILKLINQRAVLSNLEKYDVFHPSFYDGYFARAKKRPRTVITIHDMIPEAYFKEKARWMIDQKREALKLADAVIAISHTTKKELLACYDIDESRIHVIHHGFPEHFFSAAQSAKDDNFIKQWANTPYLLFVGTRKDYKNFQPFVRALSTYLKDRKIHLLAVGNTPFPDEKEFLAQLGLEDWIHFTGQVNDEILAELYRNALCFVFPSSLEGFGMPLLESFAAKCPVACANTDVFREICGDAAVYFDPANDASIIRAVDQFASHETTRNLFKEKGNELLTKFNWSDAARKTMDVYRNLN